MTFWRISNHSVLDGGGGLKASGRWHTRGRRIVYCSPNPATALLEVLVHSEIDIEDIPRTLRYLEIEVPDSLSSETMDVDAMGKDWRVSIDVSRRAGNEWLRSGRSAILRVPSVVVPATWNVLLNPQHAESAQVRILRTHQHRIDARLLR